MARMNAREPLAQLLETLDEIQTEKIRVRYESVQQLLDALIVLATSPVVNVESENREELLSDLTQIGDKAIGLKAVFRETARTGKAIDSRKLDELFDDLCAIVENAVLLWHPEMLEAADEALRPSLGLRN